MSDPGTTDSFLNHSATVDYGTVGHVHTGEPTPCVRLLFHPGRTEDGTVAEHVEVFLKPEAVPDLIEQLQTLKKRLAR